MILIDSATAFRRNGPRWESSDGQEEEESGPEETSVSSEAERRGRLTRTGQSSRPRRTDARIRPRPERRRGRGDTARQGAGAYVRSVCRPERRGTRGAGAQGTRHLARLCRCLRAPCRARPQPERSPEALRARRRGGRTGARAGNFPGRRRRVLGHPRNATLHEGAARPGRVPLDLRTPRGQRCPLARDAPAQPQRQPGAPDDPGQPAPDPRPRRRPGSAPAAISRR